MKVGCAGVRDLFICCRRRYKLNSSGMLGYLRVVLYDLYVCLFLRSTGA